MTDNASENCRGPFSGNPCYHSAVASIDPVTLFFRDLIAREHGKKSEGKKSYAQLAQQFEVSKTWVQNLHKDPIGKHTVGGELEKIIARKLFGGSVDALRSEAERYMAESDRRTGSDTHKKRPAPIDPPPPSGSVWSRIESERMRLGLSASELSELAGRSRTHYSLIASRQDWNATRKTEDAFVQALVKRGADRDRLRAGQEEPAPAPTDDYTLTSGELEQRQMLAVGLQAAGIDAATANELALHMQWHRGQTPRERFESALARAREIQAERKGRSVGVREYED